MCLIMARDPGVDVDFERLKNAVTSNPHGWGYIIPDRGKLEIRRLFDPKGTNPDDVALVLEENKDRQIFLHLRFATHGEKSAANAHPFPVLKSRKDGMQVWLMHNGTVSTYKQTDKRMSDTFHFTEQVVNPLLKRVLAYTGKTKLLDDGDFIAKVIGECAGWHSKFLLVDQYGNWLTIGQGDTSHKGMWLSNDHSFRLPYKVTTTTKTHYGSPGYSAGSPYKRVWEEESKVYDAEYTAAVERQSEGPFKEKGTMNGTGSQTVNGQVIPPIALPSPTSTIIAPTPGNTEKKGPVWPDPEDEALECKERTHFVEHLGLKDLRELCTLSESDILDIVTQFPEVSTVLIIDLLYELYNAR